MEPPVTLRFGQTFLYDGREYTITQIDRKQMRDGHSISILAWEVLMLQKFLDTETTRQEALAGTAKVIKQHLNEQDERDEP